MFHASLPGRVDCDLSSSFMLLLLHNEYPTADGGVGGKGLSDKEGQIIEYQRIKQLGIHRYCVCDDVSLFNSVEPWLPLKKKS